MSTHPNTTEPMSTATIDSPNGTAKLSLMVQTVTPELALQMLERHGPNRRVHPQRVDQYARDMKRGAWKENGETIKLDAEGRLVDGQHRLNAVVESGVPVRMAVAFNVPSDAMLTIDTGRPRGFADVTSIQGETNAIVLASVARWIFKYETDAMQQSESISHSELGDVLNRHPRLRDSVHAVVCIKNRVAPPAPLAFVHYMAGRTAGSALADAFLFRVANGTDESGTGLPAGSPAFILRERLIGQRMVKSKLPTIEVVALMIRAWLYFRAGRTIKTLRWRAKGSAAEEFPRFEVE